MNPEPGTLSPGSDGALRVSVEAERYRIDAGDIRNLLFYGRVVPITQATPDGLVIEGHAARTASGKAGRLPSRAGSYSIPRISFQRGARGEAVSAPRFPLVPGATG